MKICNTFKTWCHFAATGLCILLLVACQSKPAGLTPEQIAVLQKNGFSQTADGWELGLDAKVLFGNNQATLSPESKQSVEKLAGELLHVGLNKVNLDGHTDNYGDAGYNNDLSLHRANTVAAAFADAGMPRTNIHTRGLGQSQPVASNKTQAGRAQNRRVSVIIVV
ncbi:OmpA family protein [Rahnella sp. C60]|jgi:outer membrane protein OmpA-like peptidoglycan-associated protein|uniref:OmpA family protein n=1 Tax=Rahnella perminowiae TaxID=2816244 RepID=A0ABS6L9L5_9GAMM|nr:MULTISPECIES: OmpA family protein [Rahnella]UJD91035.1 OmpA family protein [Rahnella aquatilis]MBU9809813.1 OmpA family protein [Rahnella perminowiae]MBU9815938.1 OmpA family protein [Rahnella perminowiae]MBU9823728.1 OmpA family protein [Rahnella perminowiae]MBU9838361.1 OmpA family protein [Rahnella perminowiae]